MKRSFATHQETKLQKPKVQRTSCFQGENLWNGEVIELVNAFMTEFLHFQWFNQNFYTLTH
jgi:hypothetical protein